MSTFSTATSRAAQQIGRAQIGSARLSPGYWAIFGLGLAWMVGLWLRSPGVPVQDELGHVLIARNAWRSPALVLDLWGRAVNTLLYLLPALGGLSGARLASVLLACSTVLLTTAIAARLGLGRLWLIPALLWFQPWFGDLAYTAITEVPFAWLLALGCWLWLRERPRWAALCFGLLPLVRHEGVALTALCCGYLLLRRDWRAILAALAPMLLYNVLYAAVLGGWPVTIYFQPRPTTLYGSGSWLHFVWPLIDGLGWPIAALVLPGCLLLLRQRGGREVLACYGLYFGLQTVIYRFGLYASGGYAIFLLPLAPGCALAAALALEWLLARIERAVSPALPRGELLSASLLMIVLALVGNVALRTPPRPLDFEGVALQEAARWLAAAQLSPPRIVTTHVWFYYFADLPLEQGSWPPTPPTLASLPPGALVVWDAHYSERWGLAYAELSDPTRGWRTLQRFGDDFAVIFQKQ